MRGIGLRGGRPYGLLAARLGLGAVEMARHERAALELGIPLGREIGALQVDVRALQVDVLEQRVVRERGDLVRVRVGVRVGLRVRVRVGVRFRVEG